MKNKERWIPLMICALPLIPFPGKLALILFFGLFFTCFGWITYKFFKRE